MQTLKRIRYYTMNSWNLSTAPAYNIKVHNVIDPKLQNKVFEIMDTEEIWDDVRHLMRDFDQETDYQWQCSINGRSGGYLVLLKGYNDKKTIFKKEDFKSNNGYNGRVYADGYGWKNLQEAEEKGLVNKIIGRIGTYPGKHIDDDEVPTEVLKSFRQLAIDIIKLFENTAKNCTVVEKTISIPKTIKILKCNK